MQYILTEEEFNALKNEGTNIRKEHEDTTQKLCTMVADHKPISVGENPPKPWGCTFSQGLRHHYCDHCPVSGFCPHPNKSWSK